jgi:putative DNA-invertase from lambdoid prophage Rac
MLPHPLQHEATKEAQRAGIAAARSEGKSYLGRKPTYDRAALDAVIAMLQVGTAGTSEIARVTGLSRQTVLRIKEDPAKATAALNAWA